MTNDMGLLLERLRGAKGPDRELDAAILKSFGIHSWAGRMSYLDAPMWIDFGSSEITASIDASLALAERLLGDQWFSALLDAIRELGANGTEPPSALPRYILTATILALMNKEAGE